MGLAIHQMLREWPWFTNTMVATSVFALTIVVLFGLAAGIYGWKLYRAKQMRAAVQPETVELETHLDQAASHLALAVQGTKMDLVLGSQSRHLPVLFRLGGCWDSKKGNFRRIPTSGLAVFIPAIGRNCTRG